jgi:hypothetical protein
MLNKRPDTPRVVEEEDSLAQDVNTILDETASSRFDASTQAMLALVLEGMSPPFRRRCGPGGRALQCCTTLVASQQVRARRGATPFDDDGESYGSATAGSQVAADAANSARARLHLPRALVAVSCNTMRAPTKPSASPKPRLLAGVCAVHALRLRSHIRAMPRAWRRRGPPQVRAASNIRAGCFAWLGWLHVRD